MTWTNISEVLSSINNKPILKTRLRTYFLKKDFKDKFGIEDLNLSKGKLEIKIRSSSLAQELYFKKEEIKKEAEKLTGDSIKEVVIKRI